MGNNNTRSMGRSMLVNFAGILCSRLSGLLRDIATASYWGGTGVAQAAFTLAFSIPNMFRALFGEGAFTAAFVPAVAEKLEKGDREGAWRLAERTISLQIVVLLVFLAIVSVISLVIYDCLPKGTRADIPLLFSILPVLLPYALFICVAGAFGSILNALRSFALPAVNPVIFNVVQLVGISILYTFWKNDNPRALYFFCCNVLLAGVLQMVSMMWACRRKGFRFHFYTGGVDAEVREVIRRFIPGTIGSGAAQINQLLDKVMVGYLGPVAISSIAYSNHLVYLPVGLFGVAMGIVCLTDMSRAAARKDDEALSTGLDFALRTVMFLSLPCMMIMAGMMDTVVRTFFNYGAFNDRAVWGCVWALTFYLPGIPAFCCVKVASNPHYAYKDTRTPVRVAIFCIVLNFILNLALLFPLRQGGLALSTSICSWVNAISLLYLGRKYAPLWNPRKTLWASLQLLLAATVAGIVTFVCVRLLGEVIPVLRFALGGMAGGAAYLAGCLALRRKEPRELLSSVLHRGKKGGTR